MYELRIPGRKPIVVMSPGEYKALQEIGPLQGFVVDPNVFLGCEIVVNEIAEIPPELPPLPWYRRWWAVAVGYARGIRRIVVDFLRFGVWP